MKYAWIQQHQEKHDIEIAFSCQLLSVPISSYYSWLNKKPTISAVDKAKLVKDAFDMLQGNAGTRGIKGYLLNEHNVKMSRRLIARLMKAQRLKCQRKRKFKRGTSAAANDPYIATNLLQRQFDVRYPNQVWVTDITYIKTLAGWMYLAVYIDLYSRKVVGWALDTHMKSELIETALKRALWSRKPPKGLIVHSDQGSQYVSNSYRKLLASWGLKPSMSRRGNCLDNAVAESFFKTLKVEMVYRQLSLATAQHMRLLIGDYIGHFNHVRPHSKNEYLSPALFEQRQREMAKILDRNQIPCTKMG